MFPIKVGSNQAGFSFLDLILLIGDSVDRSTLNYCNKNPPDTPNIPIESLYMNPDLNALLTYKLTMSGKQYWPLKSPSSYEIETRQRQSVRPTFLRDVENVIEPAQPKSDIRRLPSAQHQPRFSCLLAQQIPMTKI